MAGQPNSEWLLISSVLRSQDYVYPLSQGITPDLFHAYRDEWKWISEYVVLHQRCPTRQAFLAKFPGTVVAKVNDVEHFVAEVKRNHTQWELVKLMKEVGDGIRIDDDPLALLQRAHARTLVIQSQVDGQSGTYDVLSGWEETYEDVKARIDRVSSRGQAGFPTGFPTIDQATGGPQPGDYWVIAARTGGGKTTTLIRMACAGLWADLRVQFFSLEQSRHQVAIRVHSFMSSHYGQETFKSMDLMRGSNFDLQKYRRFLRSMKKHTAGSFYINDTSRGRVSPLVVAAQIEQNKPDIVFIDYLTLMEVVGEADWKSFGQLSAQLKQLAQRYQIPIVVAAQINRGGIGREPPGIEHLSQADAIGQDADLVLTLKQMTAHVVKMRLAKYRHGTDGQTWWCRFNPNSGDYEEISGDEAMNLMDIDKADIGP